MPRLPIYKRKLSFKKRTLRQLGFLVLLLVMGAVTSMWTQHHPFLRILIILSTGSILILSMVGLIWRRNRSTLGMVSSFFLLRVKVIIPILFFVVLGVIHGRQEELKQKQQEELKKRQEQQAEAQQTQFRMMKPEEHLQATQELLTRCKSYLSVEELKLNISEMEKHVQVIPKENPLFLEGNKFVLQCKSNQASLRVQDVLQRLEKTVSKDINELEYVEKIERITNEIPEDVPEYKSVEQIRVAIQKRKDEIYLSETKQAIDLKKYEEAEERLKQISNNSSHNQEVNKLKQQLKKGKQKEARQTQVERASSRGLLCCDGSSSPSCSCYGSHRGCCSHHGGICGCQ